MQRDTPEIQALNAEFNAPGSTMHVVEYGARMAELRARASVGSVSDKGIFITIEGFKGWVAKVPHVMIDAITKMLEPAHARLAEFDARLRGVDSFTAALSRLERALDAPVIPQYDATGKLIGVRRNIADPPPRTSGGGANTALADAVEHLEEMIAADVVPIFEGGKIVGAKRVGARSGALVEAVNALARKLEEPVHQIFDSKGRVTGAQRTATLDGGGVAALEARIAALEQRFL